MNTRLGCLAICCVLSSLGCVANAHSDMDTDKQAANVPPGGAGDLVSKARSLALLQLFGVKIRPVTDMKVKSEILAMAEGDGPNARLIGPGPRLPPGYDYENVSEIIISDENEWITRIAYSTTSDADLPTKMVGLYYDKLGNFANYSYTEWHADIDFETYISTTRDIFPENYPNYYNDNLVDLENFRTITSRIRPPSQCGQRVSNCIAKIYTGNGWGSVGASLGSLFFPEVGVGVIGGCMLGCALGL